MPHTTKYGNTYTDQEWREMQEYFAQERANDKAISSKINGMGKYLRRQLAEEGLNSQQIDTVVRLFRYGEYGDANIQFTSKSRQEKLDDLWDRWNVAMGKVYNEAMNLADGLERD